MMYRISDLKLNRRLVGKHQRLIACLYGFLGGILLTNLAKVMVGSMFLTCGLRWHRHSTRNCSQSLGCVGENRSGQDKFLFIGIMTAKKFLSTRAMASNKTWAHKVPGKVVYFMEEGEKYKGDLNVVQLPGVSEHDYPPQKKSFAMLQYIARHYAKDYEWIIRADDDLYVRVDELVKFLKSVDHRKPLYLGQPGYGKRSERGKLGLSGAYCMGGPGVVMTRSLVESLAPYLPSCLNSTVSDHEDTELGRCISMNLKIICTLSVEMQQIFIHNYVKGKDMTSSFKLGLGVTGKKALTIHPFKQPSFVFKMDNHFSSQALQELRVKERALIADITAPDSLSLSNKKKNPKVTDKVISEKSVLLEQLQRPEIEVNSNKTETYDENYFHKATMINDLSYVWDLFKHEVFYSVFHKSEKPNLYIAAKGRYHLLAGTVDKIQASALFKNEPSNTGLLHFHDLTYQTLRADHGCEEIMFVRRNVENKTLFRPVYVKRRLEKQLLEFTESLKEETEPESPHKTIHILLLTYRRLSQYKTYLEQHKKAVEGYLGKVFLSVLVFLDAYNEHKLVAALTSAMLANHSHLEIQITYVNETFSRGKGMMLALSNLDNSSLILFMDVDAEYTSDFLHRVSLNTILGQSAFFPITFSLFSPDVVCYKRDKCELDKKSHSDDSGMWRSYGYGIASAYKQDVLRFLFGSLHKFGIYIQLAGGFKENIKGWGNEDVDLFEKLISTGINIIRSPDTGIIHRYHVRECEKSLPRIQLKSCTGSQEDTYGSVRQLYSIYQDLLSSQNQSQV